MTVRIGIDISVLQGGSAQRGMGRYTLQQLMATVDDSHEFFLFHQPFAPSPTVPLSLINRKNVTLVPLNFPEAVSLKGGKFTLSGEQAYTEAIQRFVAGYYLDVFHLTCFDDNAYYYTPREWKVCPLIMTVYDLIPYHMADIFLVDTQQRTSYMAALELMKSASVLIAISEDARQNVIQYLGLDENRIVVAPPYATADFRPVTPDVTQPEIIKQIGGRYIYTISSFGNHKNLKRMLEAYSNLPTSLKNDVKFVISASITEQEIPEDWRTWIANLGISNHLIWTPRLNDEDIIALYQHAEVCVHVSLIEGFGLPILEAMQCGTPVITSNRGAMKEVAGTAAYLVNPEDVTDIAGGLTEILTSQKVQSELRNAGLEQAKFFNETRLANNTRLAYSSIQPRRLKVAMWSPLPPARSGISDYTAELIPHLAKYIDLVVYTNSSFSAAYFLGLPVIIRAYAEYKNYETEPVDLHLYHMGNNIDFHEEIYFQLLKQPGIVVLHDLSIFNFFYSLDEKHADISLKSEVTYSEGAEASAELDKTIQKWVSSMEETNYLQLPMLKRIIENSLALITHSEFGCTLIHRYDPQKTVEFIQLGTGFSPSTTQNEDLRQKHGWRDNDVVFGVFGGINPIKRVHIILEAFGEVSKTQDNTHLVIVGREDDSQYIEQIQQTINKFGLGKRVIFIGEVPLNSLLDYIAAIDVAINLRWPTAGETSAVMMRVMGAGKPVIMSDMAQWSHFPSSFSRRIPLGQEEIPTLIRTISEMSQNRKSLAVLGEQARQYIELEASFEVVSQRYSTMIQSIASSYNTPPISYNGVNFIGDLHGDFGLSEACRSIVSALSSTSIDLAYEEFIYNPHSRNTAFNEPPHGMPYNVNLFQLNAPEMSQVLEKLGNQCLYGRYNIGYWFYELPQLPENWISVANNLDEIWVATEFVKNAVERSVNVPVTVIPTPLMVTYDSMITRARFGVPESAFVFLYSFSTWSSSARKNPFGLLAAFKKAITLTKKPIALVMKVHFLNQFPDLKAEFLRRAEGLPVIFLEENLSRIEMYSLIKLCDCYISLHRSEAIGLGMAEAMALGKPVIGTKWSGNLDFMSNDNSYLVEATVGLIRDEHHEFQESHKWLYVPNASIWADPNIDYAAELMRDVVEKPLEAMEKGRRAAETIQQHFNPAIIGQRIQAHLETLDVSQGKYYDMRTSIKLSKTTRKNSLGINIIGDLMSDNGLGEIARSMVKMLSVNQIPVAYDEFIIDPVGRTSRINPIQRGRVNEINLLHLNAPFLNNMMQKDFASRLNGKYNIGYWFYELPHFPEDWGKAGDYLDEIWVSTRFVKEAIQNATKTPVFVIPTPIHVPTEVQSNRTRFNLPEDKFAFLFSFNPGSSSGRKNPFGLLEAYRRAFENSDNSPLLVLKIQFLDKFPELALEIRRRCNALGVHLIEENLTRDEMYTLIASCDCYISLHRSEGWGLGMAEAMAMGKPVIGTGWSGNVDFMTNDNSYLVDYELVTVKAEHHEFQESYVHVFRPNTSHWADPDLNHAARLMRHVVENPDEAREVGRRAAKSIRDNFDDTVLGQHIRAHLETIDITSGKYYARISQQLIATPLPTTAAHTLTRISSPSPISGVDMSHLHRAFNDWNRERLRTTIRGFGTLINRIPVLGFIFRTVIRIRNLGKVWGAEAALFEALIREADSTQHQRADNSPLLIELRNEISALKSNYPLNTEIQQMKDELTSLKKISERHAKFENDITLLRQRLDHLQTAQLEAEARSGKLQEIISQLEANLQSESQQIRDLTGALKHDLSVLDEKTRLNTSQLRLILIDLLESSVGALTPSPLEVVRELEFKSPLLAAATRIDFTLHGQIDDDQTLALGAYWGSRIKNISPEVWYHFDRTEHWQSAFFFDNNRAKLSSDGVAVIIIWAETVVWPEVDGFERINDFVISSDGKIAHTALYQKTATH